MEEKLSFKEIYLSFKSKPSPGQQCINEISNLTMRKPGTVRKQIAAHLNVDEEILFPKKQVLP